MDSDSGRDQQLPYLPFQPPPRAPPSDGFYSNSFNLGYKVSPGILLVIIVLAILVFLGALAHLLVRILMRPSIRDPDDTESITAFQGQLQQLFHLHDAGVDQAFIDTLPVFHYKAILGQKVESFDCAVCLCEFEPEDKLRLLPKCSHAFHMECIDTWLLSHSTCPLCRDNLIHDFYQDGCFSPYVLVLESESESSRDIVCNDRESVSGVGRTSSVLRSDFHFNFTRESEKGSVRSQADLISKSCEIDRKEKDDGPGEKEKVVHVKLGKFRNLDPCEDSGSNGQNNVDSRRCFSMGSFEYVMDENSTLLVPVETISKKHAGRKPSVMPLRPGHRQAMSFCDGVSPRMFSGFDVTKPMEIHEAPSNANSFRENGKQKSRSDSESFSISKIWLRGKEKAKSSVDSSRRAMSFRFMGGSGEIVLGREVKDARSWSNAGSESGLERGSNRVYSNSSSIMNPQPNSQSFARKSSLLWLPGWQTKVVNSSSTSNV
ncbi:hypothetical protein MLD38_014506 [Melastoma candidum]|uniref:Uncharacterized protein n=1 Tax=Melastoma candidum TaxID=119954 RepID=A0ACB9RH76_9MYRT|nr:hypothetical protein MLD38_014506 [Melastoma candidum]